MANPRFVGEVVEENDELERDLAEMARDLVKLNEAIAVFEMSGWDYILELVGRQIEESVRTLRTRAKSMEAVEHARGELQALEWLRSLPQDIRAEHRRVADILAAPGEEK
jgi:hypothetical protein